MKNTRSFPAVLAGATSLALLLTTSAFADSRHQDETYRRDSNNRQSQSSSNRGYRENERVNVQGRITSFSRESNGYRVRLDRDDYSYWVPESYFRNRSRDLRVGVSISLGGIWRNGYVYVDAVNWPDTGGYYDRYVRGVVDRIDRRREAMWLRDERSGRIIEVAMRNDRHSRLNIDDLRRGDYVELSGGWSRGDVFIADRIESVRSGRY